MSDLFIFLVSGFTRMTTYSAQFATSQNSPGPRHRHDGPLCRYSPIESDGGEKKKKDKAKERRGA